MKFKSKNPSFEYLRKKWSNRQRIAQENFWNSHALALKQIALGSLGGLLLFSAPSGHTSSPDLIVNRDDILEGYDRNVLLTQELKDKLPEEIRPLDVAEEREILSILSRNFRFKVLSEIGGIRLNRNYGLIGGEQHLYRYPGDNLYAHADNTVDFAKYSDAGIAPHLGAWGYFAHSRNEFTQLDKQREKYYLAIQTYLIPGYAENVDKYRDFFQFRKMLVVNPKSGQAVVAVIGDAGPSEWTGKHLGGSPEVMDLLGLAQGSRKGAVLYFFIDEGKEEIPLGPVKVRNEEA